MTRREAKKAGETSTTSFSDYEATARRLAADTQARLDAEHEALARSLSVTSAPGGMAGGESAVLHAIDILEKSTETQLHIIDPETSAPTPRAKP